MKQLFLAFFKDSSGKIVLGQPPNAPIIIWLLSTCTGLVLPAGQTREVILLIGSTSLLIWALLELFQGVSYFRRTLGLVVFLFALNNLI